MLSFFWLFLKYHQDELSNSGWIWINVWNGFGELSEQKSHDDNVVVFCIMQFSSYGIHKKKKKHHNNFFMLVRRGILFPQPRSPLPSDGLFPLFSSRLLFVHTFFFFFLPSVATTQSFSSKFFRRDLIILAPWVLIKHSVRRGEKNDSIRNYRRSWSGDRNLLCVHRFDLIGDCFSHFIDIKTLESKSRRDLRAQEGSGPKCREEKTELDFAQFITIKK